MSSETRDNLSTLRKIAEKKLKELSAKPEKFSPDDISQLVHELQVYQIELEMQNEELRAAQVALEESRAKYSDLYDSAPTGYFTVDNKGIIQDVNLTGADQLRVERGLLVKKPLSRFIHKDAADVYYMHCQEVIKSGVRKVSELRIKRSDKTEFYAQLESILIKEPRGKATIRSAVINIHDRWKAEMLVKESEEKYRNIADNSLVGIFQSTLEGKFLYVNEAFATMFEYDSPASVLALETRALYRHPDQRPEIIEAIRDKGKISGYELEAVTRTGKAIYVIFNAALHGNVLSGMVMDISVRRKMEEDLITARIDLENRVRERTLELEKANKTLSAEVHRRQKIAEELLETNIALKVLLKQREEDKVELEENILSNVHSLVQPYLTRLKSIESLKEERTYLNIIESNLKEIVSPFARALSAAHMNFSPREMQVANLIKAGRQDKEIMEILHISFETVKTHRQNIRKKLGIYGTNANLRTRLETLTD